MYLYISIYGILICMYIFVFVSCLYSYDMVRMELAHVNSVPLRRGYIKRTRNRAYEGVLSGDSGDMSVREDDGVMSEDENRHGRGVQLKESVRRRKVVVDDDDDDDDDDDYDDTDDLYGEDSEDGVDSGVTYDSILGIPTWKILRKVRCRLAQGPSTLWELNRYLLIGLSFRRPCQMEINRVSMSRLISVCILNI